MDKNPPISVIMPIYNAQNYIERSARSLFEQTLSGIEYIFVDDQSTDNSIGILTSVLSEYPHLSKNVKIINHAANRGSSDTRNTGLKQATGKYVGWTDADDWVEVDMFEKLYEASQVNDADIVWCDFYYTQINKEIYASQLVQPSPQECIKALLSERMHGATWNKLVKRSLYEENKVFFPTGLNMWEDLRTNIELFTYAKHIVHLKEALYHYVQYNEAALSNAPSMEISELRLCETLQNTNAIIAFLEGREPQNKFIKEFNYLKLAAKRRLLTANNMQSIKKWSIVYPEANGYILSFEKLPLHLRYAGWIASLRLWPVLRLFLIIKKLKKSISSKPSCSINDQKCINNLI